MRDFRYPCFDPLKDTNLYATLSRIFHLLTPSSKPSGTTCTGVAKVTANSNIIAAGVATPIGEAIITPPVSNLGLLGSANLICESIITAYANRYWIGAANIVGECDIQAINIGGGGGGIDIYDEGVLIKTRASSLNFLGADITSQLGTPDVEVWVPPPLFSSHWNTTDGTTVATVADIATSNRYISAPTGEGVPFFTGGGVPWGGDGSTHPTTRTSPLVWSAAGLVSFETAATTFQITLSDFSGTIATFTTPAINGNVVASGSSITCTISGWVVEGSKFAANVSISVDVATLLPASGYFDISLVHHNAGTDYTKTQ